MAFTKASWTISTLVATNTKTDLLDYVGDLLFYLFRLNNDRYRAIIDQFNIHHCTENPRLDGKSCRFQFAIEIVPKCSACSGRAASIKLGRLPFYVSAYKVNWETDKNIPSYFENGVVHLPVLVFP